MSSGLCLLCCAGPASLDRALLVCGAVVQQGGTVVLLTYTPGLALRRTYFGLEVVVRREADLQKELPRLESLALSRGARAVYLDDERIGEAHAAALRVLSAQVPVARHGQRLCGGAGGELVVDPYALPEEVRGEARGEAPAQPGEEPGPLAAGGCFGLRYLPLHPGLRPLRERRAQLVGAGAEEGGEVRRVTVVCRDDAGGVARVLRVLDALEAWRPHLEVTVLTGAALDPALAAELERGAARSRHRAQVRPRPPGPQLGEALLADLAIVDSAERAARCAFLGTATVAFSTDPAEARRCEALARAGVAIHVPDEAPGDGALPPALLGDLLWSLCADQGRRAQLSRAGRRIIDGKGAERIAAALLDLSQARHRS